MSSPTERVHLEMAGVDPKAHRILPPHWPVDDLDIGVSLQLDERLGNCVDREFYVEYAAANFSHAARMIKANPDTPLVYFGYLPLEYAELDCLLDHEVTWPLSRRGSLDAVELRGLYDYAVSEHTGMTPVLVLRNRYVGGWRFRPELTICGEDPDDVVRNWTFTAGKLRRLLKRDGDAETGGDA